MQRKARECQEDIYNRCYMLSVRPIISKYGGIMELHRSWILRCVSLFYRPISSNLLMCVDTHLLDLFKFLNLPQQFLMLHTHKEWFWIKCAQRTAYPVNGMI